MSHIHDLFTRPLEAEEKEGGRILTVLRYEDHLLRRFGLAQVVQSRRAEFGSPVARQVADEVWANIQGEAEFLLSDLREGSPTQGNQVLIRCDHPTMCLVPFGVAFSYRCLGDSCTLTRLATHAEPDRA